VGPDDWASAVCSGASGGKLSPNSDLGLDRVQAGEGTDLGCEEGVGLSCLPQKTLQRTLALTQ
jgi:hypothetical protein